MFAKQFYWYKFSRAFQLSLCFLLGAYWLAGSRLPDGGGESYHFGVGGEPKLRSRPPVMVLTLAASQSFPLVSPLMTPTWAWDPTPWFQKSYLQLPPRCLCWSSKGASQTKLVQDWAPQMPPKPPFPTHFSWWMASSHYSGQGAWSQLCSCLMLLLSGSALQRQPQPDRFSPSPSPSLLQAASICHVDNGHGLRWNPLESSLWCHLMLLCPADSPPAECSSFAIGSLLPQSEPLFAVPFAWKSFPYISAWSIPPLLTQIPLLDEVFPDHPNENRK